ncbi:putative membrane protein [Actinacidiphila reveromycinica]|uniref:Putative membrane protein n=1 Tax=Actinacidiphila reveromycinica TaxID=659352 RepID=A0A7U3UQJ1_9ACTN|nr:DUF4267 domain-containing protein [Streptomyces sp. SN-593]BBA98535.1 putative membrane protein [Streptomyces sp. SN-593]
MTVTAYTLAVVIDVFVLFIGGRFLLQPQAAAAGYGVPARPDGDPAYLTIKGLRDGTYGVLGLVLLILVGAHAEAWFLLVAAVMPFGDTLIVLRHGGTRAVAFGVHFATAVLLLVAAGLLFAV